MSFCEVEEFKSDEIEGQNREVFSKQFHYCIYLNKIQIKLKIFHEQHTHRSWITCVFVHWKPLITSYPTSCRLWLHKSCDKAPTVPPATLISWHYLYSTPLPPSTASARGSRSSLWFLVKKVLAGQAAFAGWLVTVWQLWSVLSSLCSLSLPGDTAWCLFPSSFLFIWFSQNLLEFDGWYFCLSALFQVIFHDFSNRVENF